MTVSAGTHLEVDSGTSKSRVVFPRLDELRNRLPGYCCVNVLFCGVLGRQLPDVGFCFEGDTYGSRFGCFDGDADGKDCAESFTGDVFVYGWAFVPSSPTCLFDLAARNIPNVTGV